MVRHREMSTIGTSRCHDYSLNKNAYEQKGIINMFICYNIRNMNKAKYATDNQ